MGSSNYCGHWKTQFRKSDAYYKPVEWMRKRNLGERGRVLKSLPWEVVYEEKEMERYEVGFVVSCERHK